MSDMAAVRVQSLRLYPVKSCAGIDVKEALVVETGFDLDRAWMVVDSGGVFVTQRELPRLALVRPTLRSEDLVLRAPGMLALHLSLDTVEAKTEATVWNVRVAAYDMGDLVRALVQRLPRARGAARAVRSGAAPPGEPAMDRRRAGRNRLPGRIPAAGRVDGFPRGGEPAARRSPARAKSR